MSDSLTALVALLQGLIRALDALLRRLYGITEFTADPQCLLRIARSRSPFALILSDGTPVPKGAPILDLHFWNEHIPRMGPTGPDLAWGLRFAHQTRHSLRLLAHHLATRPDLADIVALRAETSLATEIGWSRYADLARRLGFDIILLPPPTSPLGRLARLAQHLYVWALMLTFNHPSLRGKNPLAAERGQIWISRHRLLQRYAEPLTLPVRHRPDHAP
jgi:hypothetical protein